VKGSLEMGLDSYAFSVAKEEANGNFDVAVQMEEKHELHYWRKHYDLHDLMKDIWREKGGDDGENNFNCQFVALTLSDLNRIERYVIDQAFADDEWFHDDDLAFLKKAREEINKGKVIYFWSWY